MEEKINFVQVIDNQGNIVSKVDNESIGNLEELKEALKDVMITKKMKSIQNSFKNRLKAFENRIKTRRNKNKIASKSRKLNR